MDQENTHQSIGGSRVPNVREERLSGGRIWGILSALLAHILYRDFAVSQLIRIRLRNKITHSLNDFKILITLSALSLCYPSNHVTSLSGRILHCRKGQRGRHREGHNNAEAPLVFSPDCHSTTYLRKCFFLSHCVLSVGTFCFRLVATRIFLGSPKQDLPIPTVLSGFYA